MKILHRAEIDAQSELQYRLMTLLESWPQRKLATLAKIQQVENIMQLVGLLLRNQPQSLEEYVSWAEDIYQEMDQILLVSQELTQPKSIHIKQPFHIFQASWAYIFSRKLGDAIHTLNLGALVNHLLGSQQNSSFLQSQRNYLHESMKVTVEHLKQIQSHTEQNHIFKEVTQQMIQQAVRIITSAPPISSDTDPDELASSLRQCVAAEMSLQLENWF